MVVAVNVGFVPVEISPSLRPLVARGGLRASARAERPVDHARVVLAIGQDAELEDADVGQAPLDLLDLLGGGLGQDDLEAVAADLADRDFAHPLRVDPMLERGDQLVHVEVGREVALGDLVDQDRPAREVDPQLELLRGGPEGEETGQGRDSDERELATEIFHGRSLRPAGACHQSPSRGLIRGQGPGRAATPHSERVDPRYHLVVVMHAARRIGVVPSGGVAEPGLSVEAGRSRPPGTSDGI